MPPRSVRSAKRARQYEHIKESAQRRGRGSRRAKEAKEIAAATVNEQRAEAGEAKGSTRARKTASRRSTKKR